MPKNQKREVLSRHGTVTGWNAGFMLMVAERFAEPGNRMGGPDLVLHGQFSEPVKGNAAFAIRFYQSRIQDGADIKCVGVVSATKPALELLIFVTASEIQHLLTLAASGRQLFCSASFQSPRYNQGDVGHFSVSTEPPTPEDER